MLAHIKYLLVGSYFLSHSCYNFTLSQQTQEQALAKQSFTLLGNFEGCITNEEEQGIVVEGETYDCYEKLQDITKGIEINTKLTTEAA